MANLTLSGSIELEARVMKEIGTIVRKYDDVEG